jgi:putative membrane protein
MKFEPIKTIKNFVYGVVLGSTVLMPGISAGTIGVVLNEYDSFFNSISFNPKDLKKQLDFIIPFLIGCALIIMLLSNIMLFLLDKHYQIMYFCFIGMVLGCAPIVIKHIRVEPVRHKNIIAFVAALALMLFMTFTGSDEHANRTLEQFGGISPGLIALIIIASFLSAIAMLVPGISGSLILLIMGTYTVSVEAITNLNLIILICYGAGLVLGLIVGVKLIQYLLKTYGPILFSAILGLIIGAVFNLYPGFSFDLTGALSIIFAAGLAFLPYLISKRNAA